MTRKHTTALALSFAALFAGQAMAADNGPMTRAQVKAELAGAVRTGDIVPGESGKRLNQLYPHNYPVQQAGSGKSRDQVLAELDQAIRTGNIVPGETGARLNQLYPHNYPAQDNVASKSREQVERELAEARAAGLLDRHIEA